MKSDFVRRPGHAGTKPQSRSRNPPTPNESVKKKEGVGEFSPNMVFEYKADPEIRYTCPHCHQEANMYYQTYGEHYNGPGHVLQCSLCGTAQEEA